MLLFQKRFHDAIVRGEVTVTFRRWEKPHVKRGGRYRCHPIGVLEVDRVDLVRAADLAAADARKSGFPSADDLLEYLGAFGDGPVRPDTKLFRVEFHHAGDGDRVDLALEADLAPDDVEAIEQRLARLDAKRRWTWETLALIRRSPRVAASRLAKSVGRETAPFKADVVRLKKLGLTMSFEVGYEVSPRGLAFLAARPRRRAAKAR